jgi:hypothetical protein
MELKTQTLDRVLEALSPTLATEIDRVVRETREAMEHEFESRLQTALRDAETAAASLLDAEVQRATAEATEATRIQVRDELERQFKEKLDAALAQSQSDTSADQEKLQEELAQWRSYAEAQRQLSDATSQPEILSRFLRLAEPFAGEIAVYVTKANGLSLWKARDNAAFSETISQETIRSEWYFKTINVRGKPVAAICASQPFKREALDFLGRSLEHAIEVFGLRLRAQK